MRTYRVVDLSDDEPAPLLFVLHGFGGTAEGMRGYAAIEDAVATSLDGGAIVVYPNGSGAENGYPQSWNAGGCCPFSIYEPVDDVAFFAQMIDALSNAYDVTPSACGWPTVSSSFIAIRANVSRISRAAAIGSGFPLGPSGFT